MELVRQATVWAVVLFLGSLFLIVAMGLLTGHINARGLLTRQRPDGSRYFSPQRVQLLVFTIGTAAQYLMTVLERRTCTMPEAPKELVAVLGGSHLLYLAGKAYGFFQKADQQS